MDSFTKAYVECALWSSTDESNESGGNPLDENYGPEDISEETMAAILADCERFQRENSEYITTDYYNSSTWGLCRDSGP